jgi:cytochrome b subunit of formate dehydrogenase
MASTIYTSDASDGIACRVLCMCIIDSMEVRTTGNGLVGKVRKYKSHQKAYIYLVVENLVALALLAPGKVFQQFFVRYHIREAICKMWIHKPAFLLFEFEVCIHRQVQCLEHTERGTGA